MPAKKTTTSSGNKSDKPSVTSAKPAVTTKKKTAPAKKTAPRVKKVEAVVPPVAAVVPESAPVVPVVTEAASNMPRTPAPAVSVPQPSTMSSPAPVPPAPVMPYIPPQPLPAGSGKPGMVQTIAIMTLINGILNILYGLSVTAAIVLGTFFVGIFCAPVTILPVVLGIFEIIYGAKLLANPPKPVKPSQAIAILEIIAVVSGNVVSAVVGILALIFYGDANVKAYFARLNRQA